jgi:predicted nucleotidyltransferase component of viral defense system
LSIITPFQSNLLRIFPLVADAQRFYFTGGTALSLFYLQHRRSEDLDFFTSVGELIPPFVLELEKKLQSSGYKVVVQRRFNSFAELKVSKDQEYTIIHLALDAEFSLQPYQEFNEYPGLKVSSLTDVATNKLLALFGRAALRDFIDVYCLVNGAKFTKDQLIGYAKQKDPGFDLYWLGVAFERIKLFEKTDYDLSLLFTPLKDVDLLSFFGQWRQEITRQIGA